MSQNLFPLDNLDTYIKEAVEDHDIITLIAIECYKASEALGFEGTFTSNFINYLEQDNAEEFNSIYKQLIHFYQIYNGDIKLLNILLAQLAAEYNAKNISGLLETNNILQELKGDDIDILFPISALGQNALQLALQYAETELFWTLAYKHLNPENLDDDTIETLKSAALSYQDSNGQNLLHYLLDYESATMVSDFDDICVFFGENVVKESMNILDSKGETPLIKAALKGNLEAFSKLLEHGANATITDLNGHTAVYYALSYLEDGENTELGKAFLKILNSYREDLDEIAQSIIDCYTTEKEAKQASELSFLDTDLDTTLPYSPTIQEKGERRESAASNDSAYFDENYSSTTPNKTDIIGNTNYSIECY